MSAGTVQDQDQETVVFECPRRPYVKVFSEGDNERAHEIDDEFEGKDKEKFKPPPVSASIQFHEGLYRTDDPAEIAWLESKVRGPGGRKVDRFPEIRRVPEDESPRKHPYGLISGDNPAEMWEPDDDQE